MSMECRGIALTLGPGLDSRVDQVCGYVTKNMQLGYLCLCMQPRDALAVVACDWQPELLCLLPWLMAAHE